MFFNSNHLESSSDKGKVEEEEEPPAAPVPDLDKSGDPDQDITDDENEQAFYPEPVQYDNSGPNAQHTGKLLLTPGQVDPNNFKTAVAALDKIKQWLSSGKYIHRNLFRIYNTLARNIHTYLQTGNGESMLLLAGCVCLAPVLL